MREVLVTGHTVVHVFDDDLDEEHQEDLCLCLQFAGELFE
jgi:hypothetical protein